MKIGAGADTRALNLSLPSSAAESTDISALFDELLALNVSAQAGSAPSNANPAQAKDAAPNQTPYQTSSQNFMQALLSTTQQPAQATGAATRPIPAQPGNSGFPRVAALVTNPAWPPRPGAGPETAQAATNGAQSKIVDIKQHTSSNSTMPSSGMASAKTIADLLESALSEPPAPAKAGGAAPANPAVPKPDVVMDAKSFAKIASFVMPVAAKPAPTATASPSTTAQTPLVANNPVLPAETATIPQAASDPASEFEASASPEQAEADQNAVSFADSNNVKFINSNGQLATPTATRTVAMTRTAATSALPVTVFDAIEGLRAAILPDQESTASPTLKMLAATAKQSQTSPSVAAAPDAEQQTVPQAASRATETTIDPQIARFIAATQAIPVAQPAPAPAVAVADPKNIAAPTQSATRQTAPAPTTVNAPQSTVEQSPVQVRGAPQPVADIIAVPATVRALQDNVQAAVNTITTATQQTILSVTQPKTQTVAPLVSNPAVQIQSAEQSFVSAKTSSQTIQALVIDEPVAKNVAVPAQSATPQAPVPQPVATSQASDVKNATQTQSAPQPATDVNATVSVQSAMPWASVKQPASQAAPQASDAKPALQTPSAAEQPVSANAPSQTIQTVVNGMQPVVDTKVIPQTTQPSVSPQPEKQSPPVAQMRDAEIAPQAIQNSDPALTEKHPLAVATPDMKQAVQQQPVAQHGAKQPIQQSAPQHDAKQIVSQQQDTPRDASADSKPDAQAIQQPVTAPQLVADVKDVVQSILATQVSTATVKTSPQSTDNTSARGSLASAFAAAAAKSKSQPSQSQPRAAQAPANGKLSAENTQTSKNSASAQSSDTPAASASKNQTVVAASKTAAVDEMPAVATKIDMNAPAAQMKNDAPAPADITPDNATQNPVASQLANNAPQSPQTPFTLPNDLGVTVNAAQQPNAPHTVNLAASVQVAPQSQNAAHTAQADLSALALSIAARSLNGARHFDIRLDPAELGHVQVRLSIDESGKAAAHLTAERPQTLELLQRDAPALTRALKDSGIDLSQNGLNFSLKGQNQQNGNGNGAQSRGTPLEAKLVSNPEASAIPLHIKTDNVRLDIHV